MATGHAGLEERLRISSLEDDKLLLGIYFEEISVKRRSKNRNMTEFLMRRGKLGLWESDAVNLSMWDLTMLLCVLWDLSAIQCTCAYSCICGTCVSVRILGGSACVSEGPVATQLPDKRTSDLTTGVGTTVRNRRAVETDKNPAGPGPGFEPMTSRAPASDSDTLTTRRKRSRPIGRVSW
ncbi:hypothetical protein Bbelb_257630 [Branchiostoma belcheri]|nr:hypothetical protein Bbelb_257630 [Branchiostoma belcheri]